MLITVEILTLVYNTPPLLTQDIPCWISGIYPIRPDLKIDAYHHIYL